MIFINKIRQSIAKRFYRKPLVARIVAAQFHRSFYYLREKIWGNTGWLGASCIQIMRRTASEEKSFRLQHSDEDVDIVLNTFRYEF